jgi:hypothetical protein
MSQKRRSLGEKAGNEVGKIFSHILHRTGTGGGEVEPRRSFL